MDDLHLLELVWKSKNGNAQALEDLVASCQPGAFRLALSILDDPDDADDVAQEALLRAVKSISSFRGESSFRSWLYRIIVNACLGKLRKQQARLRLRQLLIDRFSRNRHDEAAPEIRAIQDEGTQRVMQAVKLLDDDHRLPVILRYYHELPINQIAEVLNVSTRTVHTRLKQAHDRMRKVLGEYDGND